MFVLIEDKSEVTKAQKKLESSFRRDFARKTVKNIGYPGGTTFGAHIQRVGLDCGFFREKLTKLLIPWRK